MLWRVRNELSLNLPDAAEAVQQAMVSIPFKREGLSELTPLRTQSQ